MRFCPFCSAENANESSHCSACARRLPPLAPRRRTGKNPAMSPPVVRQPAAGGKGRNGGRPGARPGTLRRMTKRLDSGEMTFTDPRFGEEDMPTQTHVPDLVEYTDVPGVPRPLGEFDSGPAAADSDATQVRDTLAAGPRPSTDHGEWPAPVRRMATPDPNDWHADANRVMALVAEDSGSFSTTGSERRRQRMMIPTPPPTRLGSTGAKSPRVTAPEVVPVPEVPEPGWVNVVGYAVAFARARWQRRSAIRSLDDTIKKDTTRLDEVLGTLGQEARSLEVDNRVLEAENQAIDQAENRHAQLERALADLSHRQAEEDRSFSKIEGERQARADSADAALDKVEQELAQLEARRRGLRDKRKGLERKKKTLLESAEERDEQAGKSALGDARAGLRRAAEELREDAADLDPELQDIDRELADVERPVSQALARIEARKAERDAARRTLEDAREGHRHRLAELEAEQSRKKHELAQAGAEIQRRLVTLGTLVNLHRIERPEFDELYSRIDALRGAIGARSSEIDRLTAEREAYDRASLVRGFTILGILAAVLLLLVILVVTLVT